MELSIIKQQENTKENIAGFLEEAVMICLISGCGLFCAARLFMDDISLGIVAAAAVSGALCALLSRTKRGMAVGVIFMAVVLAGFFVWNSVFLNGLTGVWNEIADIIGKNTDIYLKKYQVLSEGTLARDMQFFMWAISAAVSAVVFGILRWRWRLILLLSAFVLPAVYIILGKAMTELPCALYYLGIVLGEKYMISGGKKSRLTGNRYEEFLWECTLFLLIAGLGTGIWTMAMPVMKYKEPVMLSAIRERAGEAADRLRFQKEEINSLPKGRLDRAGAWSASEDTALEVTMEEPRSLYLRGFVGSVYEENRWKSLDSQVYYDNKNLFYWLHENGFYGNRQLSGIRNLIEDDELSGDRINVSIKNVGADSEYLYVPYEMTEAPEGFSQECAYGDEFLKSGNIFGTRSYSFQTMGNLVKDFPKLAAQGYLALKEENNQTYREIESYYNSFVYKYNTQLSDSMRELFRKELGTAGNQEKGHLDYYSAITHIRKYLEKNMTYGSQTEVVPEGKDFVKNFLTESKIGYSIHFASAAALMFRYYGIPSRYVEGYLITPENAENTASGGTTKVTGKDGHAWTEIYIDGTGWVPVEMTPEYYGIMEEPDLTAGLEADGTRTAQPPEIQEEKEEPLEENDLKEVLSLVLLQIGKILLWAVILFDIFCLIFFLWVFLCRMAAKWKRRRAFLNRDNGYAARQMVKYAEQLYQHKNGDFTENVENLYKKTYRIGEKAAFSRHEISAEERRTVEECVRLLLKELKKMRGWYERWIMRYIERLY